MWENELCRKEREQCFGIQPKYQSYCRASGNSHIPVNTCGITRARAPGHQPSQILSHTKQYHPPYTAAIGWEGGSDVYWLFICVLLTLLTKRPKRLPAAKPRENNHHVLNMIQLHFAWNCYIFIEHFCCSTATILSHTVVKVAKWHTIFTVTFL